MIKQMNLTTHVFVLYDSIENSVFESQVLQPLIELKKKFPTKKVMLISFEKRKIKLNDLKERIPLDKIEVIILKKFPFFGLLSLFPALYQLKRALMHLSEYDLIARGPIAGYLCLRTHGSSMHSFTIQIRGLLAQEYCYAHRQEKNWFLQKLHAWRASLYEHLEKKVYTACLRHKALAYEVVSEALGDYIHATFGTPKQYLKIAQHDIPPTITAAQVQTWRCATRTTLGLHETHFVYCYNGSLKSWQCPEKLVAFFQEIVDKNPQSFLLIITPHAQDFQKLLLDSSLSHDHYKVISSSYDDIFHYLAACDAGIIFREEHILNWISRPTKILEYYAVGLPVIHNNTVGLLVENKNTKERL